MKKWAGAAIAYLVLVMACYAAYDSFWAKPEPIPHDIEIENHE
ncbi:hypothetical protein ACOSZF_21100 [Cytobacillus firmus]|uniref:Lipoprotein n=1 Tax=Cytobacillus firmus TaxID=1399 RepID=A0A380XWE6_CYTFI|nr:hypothetical protein [Cytobacillus firmus]KAF0821692.1 hypothetical protein KIS1582_4545 [Cytobacillus firmus]MDD9311419.1 hypothetical protein [Cytobacillus firmus]MEC1894515.1 hypothetical protein [Cytobacillus firmus]MED1908731.1 hypothetical protein [Cytobacillus firmus]MED1942874.1 hypothetical protein [Cytobacillus firmus]